MTGIDLMTQLDEVTRERDQLRESYNQAKVIIKTQQDLINKMVNDFKTTQENVDQLEKRCGDLVVKCANLCVEGTSTSHDAIQPVTAATSGSEDGNAESGANAESGEQPEGEDGVDGPRDI
ncbi:hypothetical protein B9Z55_025342 [Caenorhabditis nigoni]|uniref:Uncharacterized protein n=1 Tax=Caenorhabditis nigoni TaxID=1611254 RepID=A0A2G5SYL7_9PELO|nr:hypothetical protein B9Z55_025342 [Caenorhabditis nigoni]